MPQTESLDWPLMANNITRADLDAVIAFLQQDDPILTQSKNVVAFEEEWSNWAGVKHSVFVNSGSSANTMTIAAIRHAYGQGEIIVPTLTWVSDIAATLHTGMDPVFVDINPRTLGMDLDEVLSKITSRTKAIFLTHILGYNALTEDFVAELQRRNIPLIEDVCESHGATCNGKRLGSLGNISNFSYYYAHHLSTIEGGMICTNDAELYEICRMLRSHGMTREIKDPQRKQQFATDYPDLNPDFIFAYPAWNFRSTEINAVIGRSQLPRLDANNEKRRANLKAFLSGLDDTKFFTDFEQEGSSNYAFTLVLKHADDILRDKVESTLRAHKVEFRRGTSGGGNQLRQPYLRRLFGNACDNYPKVNHVHFYGWYIGNYPDLEPSKIGKLTALLNSIS